MVQQTLAQLEAKCKRLNLAVVQKGKRPAKADYVDVLKKHFMGVDYPTGQPFEEIEPMLCFASWNLKEEELAGIWRSPGWIADEKANGCRLILHFLDGEGVFAHSRTVSVKTYRREEHTNCLLFADYKEAPFEIILDVEAIVEKPVDTTHYTVKGQTTKTSLHSTTALLALEPTASKRLQREQNAPLTFKVLDIVKWNGADGRYARLAQRLIWIEEFFAWINSTELGKFFIRQRIVRGDEKKAFCKEIWTKGGEGVVLKNLNSTYEASSSRQRDAWVKVKKRIEFDAFVSGFERGDKDSGFENLVGNLEFSVYTETGELHMLGKPINMTMEMRKEISRYDPATDSVSMVPEMLGRVAEISGQDISARTYRLSHCTIERWRDQPGDTKNLEDCKVNMVELRQAAEWVG